MANAAYVVSVLTASLTSSVSTLTPTTKVGSLMVENLDGTNSLYFTLDGTVPVAGFGNGAIQLLPSGIKWFNAAEVATIKACCNGADTANLQVVCQPATVPMGGM